MKARTKREIRKEKIRRQKTRTIITWGVVGVTIVTMSAYLLWINVRPAAGQSVPVMEDTGHVEEGQDPGPYNSNPPTSGKHYANEYEAGFYEENSPEARVPYPEGYLGHNLEHGYVIIWYNCDLNSDEECSLLKGQIKSVIEDANNFKVIAFPWKTIDEPVMMTSWGQIERFDNFDPKAALNFISRNRNHAPEPNAP
ncbi:MAG: DUF3105 domain-containing protein [Chloroflexota bacterium]|nr:DUF3105 domain-containing protein [Chloroflexota bacterium]